MKNGLSRRYLNLNLSLMLTVCIGGTLCVDRSYANENEVESVLDKFLRSAAKSDLSDAREDHDSHVSHDTEGNAGTVRFALDYVEQDELVDFRGLDNNSDQHADLLGLVRSGFGAEIGGVDQDATAQSNRIWSQQWAIPNWTSPRSGVQLNDYEFSTGLRGTSDSVPCRIGLLAHETAHFFRRLPDLYDGKIGFGFGARVASASYSQEGRMELNGDGILLEVPLKLELDCDVYIRANASVTASAVGKSLATGFSDDRSDRPVIWENSVRLVSIDAPRSYSNFSLNCRRRMPADSHVVRWGCQVEGNTDCSPVEGRFRFRPIPARRNV